MIKKISNLAGCRAFITAILDQAYIDSINRKYPKERRSGRQFINKDNPEFKYYCGLLDVDPEFIERALKEKIKLADIEYEKKFWKYT